ncbi:hypothetical protein OYC64_019285 [Pagothenia borchgrevinki]|uniref:M-AAA protease-interacting protein 1, mitochondrial n=1 Tax=Pagothenia borchgrevinki TaxID=8213 RepID=A0ABD2GTF4_PAGBO
MALPVLRGCHRVSSTLKITRLFLNESPVLNRGGRPRLTPPPALRPFSSAAGGQQNQNQKVMVFGIPNPFIWVRTRMYYFLIRVYFDKEFRIEEFSEGAKQAFSHVSRLLSKCQLDALEGLVAKDLIGKLEEKLNLMPSNYKKALSVEPEEIMYTTPGDVRIYYHDDGRTFVSILMRFWYLTSARLPEDTMEGTRVFQVALGEEGKAETKRLLSANYEFQREFTKGVAPAWTITRIEHSKLLD